MGDQDQDDEARVGMWSEMDNRHTHVFSIVGWYLGLDRKEIEVSILEQQQVNQVTNFFKPDGPATIMFFYQATEQDKSAVEGLGGTDTADTIETEAPSVEHRTFFVKGDEKNLCGTCIFLVRPQPSQPVMEENMKHITSGKLEIAPGENLLQAISQLLSLVYVPVLNALQTGWGKVDNTVQIKKLKDDCLSGLLSFSHSLEAAEVGLKEVSYLKRCEEYDLSTLSNPTEAFHAAMSPDVQWIFERCLKRWMKQVTKILDESDQIRLEPDTVGPKMEMIYWKQRQARFSCVVDQLRSQPVKLVVGALVSIKSRRMRVWREVDMRITDAYNEAKDNVQYLSTLERQWLPLYFNNPITIQDNLTTLIKSLQTIHTISKYYRYPDRMAAVFVKVTNQLILMSKCFIDNEGVETIWSQSEDSLVKKLDTCIDLKIQYRKAYDGVQEKLRDAPNERPMEISEVLVFGRFDIFCRRLEQVKDLVLTLKQYNHLLATNFEELMETDSKELKILRLKFAEMVQNLKKKPYNFLDHKRREFDLDYAAFRLQMEEVQESAVTILERHFKEAWATPQALVIMRRLEKLQVPGFSLVEKYKTILTYHYEVLRRVAAAYEEYKQAPPLARNMSPLAGKIYWARQLHQHMEDNMEDLKTMPQLLVQPEARKVIALFNKMGKALMQYEMDYHEAWFEQMDRVRIFLRHPIICHDKITGELAANFSPMLWVALRDCELMVKANLELPAFAQLLMNMRSNLKINLGKVKALLKRNATVRAKVRTELQPLMISQLEKLDKALEPGLSGIVWSHLDIRSFENNVYAAIEELEELCDRTNDICSNRIDLWLEGMTSIKVLDLPQEASWTLDEFVDHVTRVCDRAALMFEAKNKGTESAVHDLLYILLGDDFFQDSQPQSLTSSNNAEMSFEEESLTPNLSRAPSAQPSTRHSSVDGRSPLEPDATPYQILCQAAADLHVFYNQRVLEGMLKQTKIAIENLQARLVMQRKAVGQEKNGPLFLVEVSLAIPKLIIRPSLEQLQSTVNKSAAIMLDLFKRVSLWDKNWKLKKPIQVNNPELTVRPPPNKWTFKRLNQPRSKIAAQNYYRCVSENKDMARHLHTLSHCILELGKNVSEVLDRFSSYHIVWKDDRQIKIKQFVANKPAWPEFEDEIIQYEELKSNILDEPTVLPVGVLALNIEQLKFGLEAEACGWIADISRACRKKYCKEMSRLLYYISSLSHRLSRSVRDLDDVRSAMATLAEIREHEVGIELAIGPVEDSYHMLQKQGFSVNREELERVDTLRYTWQRLQAQALDVQDLLLELQKPFCEELLANIDHFQQDLITFDNEYHEMGPMTPGLPPQEANDRLNLFQNRFDNLFRKYTMYQGGEELFGLSQKEYPVLQKVRKELNLLQKLYKLYVDVMDRVASYYDVQWSEVDIDSINNELMEFHNRCRKLPKALKEWPAFTVLKKTIDDFSDMCPLLELMSNKAMKQRHWSRIMEVISCNLDIHSKNCTLRSILEAPVLDHKEDIEDICISAVKEKDIEAKLKQVTNEWSYTELTFAPFKNRGELLLRGDNTAEIIARMEDSLVILGSLLNNRYNAPFRGQIQKWVQDLSNTAEVLEKWLLVQNLWVYLEAVFVGGDIAKQLPKEARLFYNIDKSWQKIMQRAQCMSVVVQCCSSDDMLKQLLPHLQEQLELCQKSLSGYLEKKRFMFPRFFFVSDPALLEILGQASDSHTIQAHLLSIFDNTKSVMFHEQDYNKILSIVSSEGEVIPLRKPVHATGTVETWLMNLLVSAQQSLHGIIRDAATTIQEPGLNPMDFFEKFPSQVGLLGLQMLWTRDSEIALMQAKHDKKYMTDTNNRFLDLLNQLIDKTTHDLAKMKKVKFETLITIHVHQRDIFDALCQRGTKSVSDFEWLKQCRFYFREETDKTVVCITDINFTYQNEFLGCTDRLVITPLTDRCYITLAQALGMSMGGCSAGPAGTGKTETVKDMGKTLGKYVVVFNCSDQMDYRGLGRIFKGLVQSGSWGCFDEFNRIDLPVLSVAAQQISSILMCKKDKRKQFIFTDGDTVDMNPEFGIFTTMNPGYAGRHELPENLKIQFRTVAMMVPDRQIIIRVKLASCGYLENITLARKFYTLYKLCEEQLTKQVHYDFGLRNILSVLRTLGAAKKVNKLDSESTIVMRVLRDMNLSKLVDEDEPLFMSLIDDLFPNVILDKKGYPELENVIHEQVMEAGLKAHPPWMLKLIQLYETQKVRHGIMILGPSGSGKTSCIHVLMKALTKWGQPHREVRMNPKSITAPQMFGRLDVTTNDWTDGIFSTLWRKTLKVKPGDHVWLVLDGPVDAFWIENLNSVLDDNKTLTLANGDRISMSPTCKVLFEPHNIDNASPATVSRAGMVYMSSSALDWKPVLQSWLKKRPYQESRIIGRLFEKCFADIYQWSRQNLNYVMPILECNIITQMITLLEGLLPFSEKEEDEEEKEEETEENNELAPFFEHLYIFAIMWSIGAFLEHADRLKLESYIANSEFGLDLPNLKSDFKDDMFCYLVNEKGEWQHWSTKISPYTYPENTTPDFTTILVPHISYACTDFLLQTVAKQGKAALLLGEQGTAKTVTIKGFMQKYNTEVHLSKSFNFSSASTPMFFQRTIESYVEKRMGTTFGAPGGKKMTIFIDDINMPSYNEWGDQCTNEILRQTIETNGFYSLERPGDFITIINTQFLAAMGQPGGGRNDIPSRLKRHFSIFNCTLPKEQSIDSIFSTIACGYYSAKRGFNHEVMSLVAKLVPVTRKTVQVTKAKMLPTPAKFHYVFNLRDLSRIWQGMLGTISTVVDNETILVALWKHELHRVISDRFTNLDDSGWFEKALLEVVHDELGPQYVAMAEPVHYFVDFLRDAPEPTGEEGEEAEQEQPKVYEPIESFDSLKDRLQMFLTQYNEMIRGNGLDLVFFNDAMIHLVRVSRIIRTAGGNALLVGVGGSGKQSLTKMASFIAGYKTFQLTLTRSYNVTNFVEDLKVLYRTTGIQGKGTTFIFTDQDVKEEGFLEYLNSLLVSGVIFNLFTKEEQSEIMTELTPTMKRENPRRPVNIETVMEFFLNRCRQNLHVVLCFSPVGEKFRNRAYRFPGLISGCTVDWFQPWPRDALIAVAQHFLADFEVICAPNIKQALVETMGCIQDGVANCCAEYFQRFRRPCHVTPKSYLSFVNSYKTVYTQKQEEIQMMADRMDSGLAKLEEASVTVEKLKLELDEMERGLDLASKKAEGVLKEVCSRAEEAETIRNQVSKSKDKAELLVKEIAADKAFAEEKLEEARPALEEAEDALNTIKPAHIATVRKLGRPPHLIMRIMDCVLLLFLRKLQPVKEDAAMPCCKPSWNDSLKMMSNTNFLQMLQQFPKDTINDEMVELLGPYIQMEDYDLDTARRVCGDVAGLLSWTKAMVFFFSINKEVLPLKANLAVQEVRLQAAIDSLNRLQGELDQKEQELNGVKSQYEEALGEKQALVTQADNCRKKMNAATALITGLTGEKDRWTEQSKQFKAQLGRLVGDVLLATAFLSYSGPFNQEFRNMLLSRWQDMLKERRVPVTQSINIVEMLVENSTVAEWTMQGLPNDELSIQNGIIVTKASCYPLLIDPQGQGKNWIKNKDLKNELQITSLNHKYFRTHLEDSLSLGRPLLIEDVGLELDPVLDNLLEKNFIKAGSSYKVMLGDKECDIMSGFMLYLTTKLANPAFTPEISAKTAIIDFAVTMQGLEDQLLGRVILTEKSELESERVQLMEEVIRNKRSIKDLEDNLLNRLTSSEYSLVDDVDLINVLEHTKATARDVSDKLKVSAETERKINRAREEFRPVATRGSILYFLIVEMSAVNYMYQTSLRQFLVIFDQSMARSIKSHHASERIKNINKYLTYEVYKYSVRGFYERHKFLFTILLALKIDLQAGRVTHKEFMTLIKGGASLDLKAVIPKPFRWIPDITWLNLVELAKLSEFEKILLQPAAINQMCSRCLRVAMKRSAELSSLNAKGIVQMLKLTHLLKKNDFRSLMGVSVKQVSENEKDWKSWYDREAPEREVIPDGYNDVLDPLHRLLLIRTWCPDRTISQARQYIGDSLGEEYSEGIILDLEATWKESDEYVPLICFLSVGSDPTNQIEALAKKVPIELRNISMGQGQEVHARRLLSTSMTSGSWVLLQNCHLSLQFCDEVMETVLETENIHPDFRLWMTTESHKLFPIGLLQMSIKFTNEPPQGIKASLKRTYTAISQDLLDYTRLPQWQPLLYAVAFLHTVVQERRKYGPLGWNIPYEFNQADFNSSVQFIQNHLDDMDMKKGVCWTTICYMLAEVQYGGRVTDDFDKRLLNSYLEVWFNEDLYYRSFCFYKGYNIPYCNAIPQYLEHVTSLPPYDSSEVFGLHPNADITYQINTAKEVLDIILNVQPKEGGSSGGESREATVQKLTNDMLSKLPKDYVAYEVRDALQQMGPLLPMNIVLRQEIDRMQRVLKLVRMTLSDLILAIEGTIIMSEELKDALDSIYDARVPVQWRKVSWESSTLGFWFTELVERNNQLQRWLAEGRPDAFWMTGFFNPQGFLTAMRQEITRAHKGWALDSVLLQNAVTKMMKDDVRSPPAEGVYLYGLFIEGAGWDRKKGRVVESRPKVLFEPMPVIHMFAVNTVSDREPKLFECPVYKKPQRSTANYITSVDLRSNISPYHWIFRGVALLCDTK